MPPQADSLYRIDIRVLYLVLGSYLAAFVQNARDIKGQRRREHSHHQPTSQRTFSNHFLTMKLTSTIVSLAALFTVAFADTVRYNTFYDNASTSLNNVACSNGENGLITKGFTTLGSLPTFPNVGGVYAVKGWNSPECGSCWRLTYKGKSIYVTAIDTIFDGFDISLGGMNTLTNGKARVLDQVDALATQVDAWHCGL
ncbi:Cerato-platanin-domain-containing protein [Lactarius hatsudake]|nr:Cerato-platanin-domain-containing protein [Lactarius hatsudake]